MVQMRFLTVSRCSEKPDKEKVGAGIESLLLRGCTVRNTEHAVGFVVYTGTFSIFSAASLRGQGARIDSDFLKSWAQQCFSVTSSCDSFFMQSCAPQLDCEMSLGINFSNSFWPVCWPTTQNRKMSAASWQWNNSEMRAETPTLLWGS